VADIEITPEKIATADGFTLISREEAAAVREAWTALHPPAPGLRWSISWGIGPDGTLEVRDRELLVIPGWEDAFAPEIDANPSTEQQRERAATARTDDQLGALAYQGWRSALPDIVREHSREWHALPLEFRRPMISAAAVVWQHGENAGYTEALHRTLPSGKLGAAGEIENLRDGLTIRAEGALSAGVPAEQVLRETLQAMTERVAQLREQGRVEARRENSR
jgi:hypothetical protein